MILFFVFLKKFKLKETPMGVKNGTVFLKSFVNGGMIFGSLFALFLVGTCFIAIGIFISSITENQFATIVLTIASLLVFMLLGSLNNMIKNEAVRRVLDCFSLYSRFSAFTYGIFDYMALVYYLLLAGLFLFLTARVYKARRSN